MTRAITVATAAVTGRRIRSPFPARPRILLWVELERHACDLDLISRLKPVVLEGIDHADAAQPPLEIREGVFVVQVIARNQPFDPTATDPEASIGQALYPPPALGGRSEDAVLDDLDGRLALCAGLCGLSVLGPDRYAVQKLGRQLVQPQPGDRRGDDHRNIRAQPPDPPLACSALSAGVDQVRLRECEHARERGQPRIMELQLAFDRRMVGDRIGSVQRHQLEHVHQQPGALDVRKELMAQPGACSRALDQPRDVGDHQLAVFGSERTQHRLERGERIVGDLWVGARQPREQRGLAGVGQAHESHVGEQLELEVDPRLLSWQPALGKPWCLVGWTGEALVPPATGTPSGENDALPGTDQIQIGPIGFEHSLGTRRHQQLELLAVLAVAQRALSVPAPASLELRPATEALKIAPRVIAHQHNVSAAPSVAAVRTAFGYVRFPAKAQASVSPGSGLNVNTRTILHWDDAVMPDPVFLITGASSGIGAATARHAAAAGYRLVLAARSRDRLLDLAYELGGAERALAVQCDVTEWEQQVAMVEDALDAFGRLDVAFANAGFGARSGFLEESPEHWRAMVLTNVYGAALTIRATIPALKEARGHLLLTGSVAGRRAVRGSLYSATKWAVSAMGESARQELNETGVRVTPIEPGMVATPFYDQRPSEALEADDVARAVMFAVSQPPHVDVNEILVRPTGQSG